MALHDALSSQEILEQIFEYLSKLDPDADIAMTHVLPPKQDLLSCALTCKSFLGPSLRMLWKSLDSLFPLLKLLPNFVMLNGSYVLLGDVDEKNWTRFDSYARLVREFFYTDFDSPDNTVVKPSVYFRLAQIKPKLLPALTRFYSFCTLDENPEIFLFLSPSLENIQFRYIDKDEKLADMSMFLSYAVLEATSLTSLIISGDMTETPFLPVVAQFKALRSLSIQSRMSMIDIAELTTIGSLEHLIHLEIHALMTSNPEQNITFRSLKTLVLSGPMGVVHDILDILHSNYLKTVDIDLIEDISVDSLRYLCSILASRWPTTLESITFDCLAGSLDSTQGRKEPIAMSELIYPLLTMCDLQALLVLAPFGSCFQASDEDIATLASAWPKLRLLDLPLETKNTAWMPTVMSLHTLSRLCPFLQKLVLAFDPGHLPPVPSIFSSHGLKSMTYQASIPIPQMSGFIHHLDTAFPNICEMHHAHDKKAGERIEDMLKLCQRIRAAERQRWLS